MLPSTEGAGGPAPFFEGERIVPIYEYRCRKCQGITEKIQGVQDPPLRKCPSCGGKLEKVMSPGSFVLKGSGWYASDYAHKGGVKGKETTCPAAGGTAKPACTGCPKAD